MGAIDVIELALTLLALLILMPASILFIETTAAFLPPRTRGAKPISATDFAILVPAHNEATNIRDTLAAIVPQLSPRDRVIVIADNCTDATASIARAAGAEVIERDARESRGKGFALAFGLRHLASAPPKVVLIIDADCHAEPKSLALLAAASASSGRPVQALYELVSPDIERSSYLCVASFAWRVKNFVRPLGLKRLGLPCQLMGSGMAFPWSVISASDLASSDIVEDLTLGLELARKGHAPQFLPEARITSPFPLTPEGQETQRARWETGHLNTIARRLPAHALTAIANRDLEFLALVLDAAVPPVAFLALATVGISILTIAASLLAGIEVPLCLAMLSGALLMAAIVLAWARTGTRTISVSHLSSACRYTVDKVGLYRQIISGRQIEWVRSKRDDK